VDAGTDFGRTRQVRGKSGGGCGADTDNRRFVAGLAQSFGRLDRAGPFRFGHALHAVGVVAVIGSAGMDHYSVDMASATLQDGGDLDQFGCIGTQPGALAVGVDFYECAEAGAQSVGSIGYCCCCLRVIEDDA
jgi:hypothetical protein